MSKRFSKSISVFEQVRGLSRVDYDEDDISERSYVIFDSYEDFTETFLSVTMSLEWLFTSAFTNFILYFIESYQVAFDPQFKTNFPVFATLFICNVFVFMDIYSSLMRSYMKFPNKKFIYHRYSKIFFVLETISIYTIIIEVLNVSNRYAILVKLVFLVVRNHKIPLYHIRVSNTDRIENLGTFMTKYVLIYAFILHTFTCIYYLSCNYNEKDSSQKTFLTAYVLKNVRERNHEDYQNGLRESMYMTPAELYTVVSYFTIGSISHIGFGNPTNSVEVFICIGIIVISLIVNVILICDLAALKMESIYNQAEFTNRLSLIKKYMNNGKFSPKTVKRTLNYYRKFWQRNSSYQTKFYSDIIPTAMHTELKLDQFWFAIHQAYIFKDETLAVKRSIANIIEIEHFNKGDFITDLTHIRNKIFFIAQGSVSLLSLEDNESSLLSLGVGTSFGNISLIYNYVDKCSVVAETYCILHTLNKSNFWYIKELQCFRRSGRIFRTLQERISIARRVRHRMPKGERTLNRVKKLLKDVEEFNIYDERNIYQVEGYSEPYASYIRSKVFYINFDGLFIRTIWPWKLRNDTSLIHIWELIIIISTFILLIVWPLPVYFYGDLDSNLINFLSIYFGTVFIMDVVIQLSTAVETSTGLRIQFTEIVEVRCSSWIFLFDVLAAVPFDTFLSIVDFSNNDFQKLCRVVVLSAKLLKTCRLPKYLTSLELKYVNIHKIVFKCIKHFLVVLSTTYIVGLLNYLLICFHGPKVCRTGSVISNIVDSYNEVAEDGFIRLVYSFFFSLMLIIQNTLFFIGSVHELHFILFMSLLGLFLFQYALSELIATALLSKSIWNKHLMMSNNTQRYMILRKFPFHVRLRVLYYFEAQWLYDCGMRNRDLFFDLPDYLYNEQQTIYYNNLCKEVPLFQNLDPDSLRTIASKCKTVFLPPGEIVVYRGATVTDMYIINKGSCEIVSEISGRSKRILSAKDHFCSLNMLFDTPLLFNIKTLTYVSLVKIARADCIYSLKMMPQYYADVMNLIGETKRELEATCRMLTVVQTRPIKYNELNYSFRQHKTKSWCVFQQTENDNLLYMEYLKKFKEKSFYTLLKYITMRRTIFPNGSFCFYWEYFRTFCVWVTCMINPVLYIYEIYFPNIRICTLILYLILITDIFLQMHVGYYTEKGIVVTHPIYTFKNYLKSHFFLDLLGTVPLDQPFIYHLIQIKPILAAKYAAIASLLKFLLLFRSRCLVYRTKTFKKQTLWVIIPYTLMIFTAVYNFFACLYMLLTGEFYEYASTIFTVRPLKFSWIYDENIQSGGDIKEPIYFYITCMKLASSNLLLLGYICNDSKLDVYEKMISIICGIIGYLVAFSFVLKEPWDTTVSNFYTAQRDLKQFLKHYKISKPLTKRTIDYFNYIWKYTLFIRSKNLGYLPDTIQQDIVLCVYGSTLLDIPLFKNMGTEFVRTLGLNFDELYIVDGMDIILVNDILEKIYIVHRGDCEVIAADGTILKVITKGSIFGNLDNISMSRSMVKIRAVTNVELIEMKTANFYNMIRGYSEITRTFNHYILLDNMCYIPSNAESKGDPTSTKTKFETFIECINIKKGNCYELFFYVINYLYVSFFLTFPFLVHIQIILYVMDLIMYFNIFFYISNAIIYSRHHKKKKLPWYFYNYFLFDVLSAIPIEIIPRLIFGKHWTYYMFHSNRLLRIIHIINIFIYIGKRVDKAYYRMKIMMLISFVVITIHTGACIFYITAYWTKTLSNDITWLNQNMCDTIYFCSFFYSLSTFSVRGHRAIVPVSICDTIVHILFATGCKYMLAYMNRSVLSLLSHFWFGVTQFNSGVQQLKRALKRSFVSRKIVEKILHYTHQVWVQTRGHHIPQILNRAPETMISEIKMEAFGKHLLLHPIFAEAHQDFLRQLVGKMQLMHYFPSDVICEKGEINATMYFIQSGIVEVVDILKTVEFVIDILQTDDSFGVVQGLVDCTEHSYTFRATHVTNILSLEYKDWYYLLNFFPATKFSIYDDMLRKIYNSQQ